jgi:hypothetical protein
MRALGGQGNASAFAPPNVVQAMRSFLTTRWCSPVLVVEDCADPNFCHAQMEELQNLLGSPVIRWALSPEDGSWEEQGAAIAQATTRRIQNG